MEGRESSQQQWRRDSGRGPSRKKRGKQRPQHNNRGGSPSGSGGSARVDMANRERIFQDIEGLLRQIREQAEETARWTDEQVHGFVANVTAFTKSLEQQDGNSFPPRLQSDYQQLRDKLAQALRG